VLEEAMGLHRCTTAAVMASLLLVGSLTAHASPDASGVTVALLPSQQVAPGATFDLYIQVTQAGSVFNGFDAVIGYDPAALTFVPGSNQEGSYMTGACGNTFHVFQAGAATDTITDVLLCNGVSLPGPGQLYHLRFQASMTVQVTEVQFLPGLQFYNAGLYVNPVTSSNVLIGVGMPVSVAPPGKPARLSLAAAPNPSPGTLTFRVESNLAGPETLTVVDVMGRTVRRFTESSAAPGVRTIAWDGRDEAGVKLPPGMYLARLEVAGKTVRTRVTLLH
jgi:hypothetical protein